MFSYDMLADRLIDLANVDWNGRESQRNSCRYGIEMLISTVVNFLLVLLIGSLLGIFKETVIYLVIWGSLRIFSGGRHASNHRNCIVAFIAIMVLVIFISNYLLIRVDTRYYEMGMLGVAFILNVLYAGNHKTNPISKKKSKNITLGILMMYIGFVIAGNTGLIGSSLDLLCLTPIITGAILAESLFLVPFQKAKNID